MDVDLIWTLEPMVSYGQNIPRDIMCKVLEAPPKLYLRGPRFPMRSGSSDSSFLETWQRLKAMQGIHKGQALLGFLRMVAIGLFLWEKKQYTY